jgi:phosphoesterase RecJ-like protein
MPRKTFLSNLYAELSHQIHAAKKILCTTHINPDADGIGSAAALCLGLKDLHKKTTLLLEHKLHKKYHHLVHMVDYIEYETTSSLNEENINDQYDLVLVVDTNHINRTGNSIAKLLKDHPNIIFIDHHPFDNYESKRHYIDSRASATGEMVGHLLDSLNIQFTKAIALALYTAILIDTNVFRYPSVTADTHRLIAKLLDTGLTVTEAYNVFHGSKKVNHMHLLGHILKNAKVNDSGSIAWIWISEADLEEYQSELEDTNAYINNLLSLDGIKVACMFREEGSKTKISLRSHGDIDVALIAQSFGGGGHSHSAAALLTMSPSFNRDKISNHCIQLVEDFLKKNS